MNPPSLASTFSWLAYSEREQREAQDLASTLSEKETRDELGVGAIRDALADRLFPGTSTIQSRARYFLFVPWIFQLLEAESPGNSRQRADSLERRLAATLRRSPDTVGLVGGRTLQVGRLPSSIYWNGLGVLRIRRYPLALGDYYRWLDDPHRKSRVFTDDDGFPLQGEVTSIWEDIPSAPTGFLDETHFSLTGEEAMFLLDRAEAATPDRVTYLGFLLRNGRSEARATYPWAYPWRAGERSRLPTPVREELEVAELFSLGHHGAALLFNLLIAEARADDVRIDEYRAAIAQWSDTTDLLAGFDLARLWALMPRRQVAERTRSFVEQWFQLVQASGGSAIAKDARARELVRQREMRLKGSVRSRIANPFRIGWNGASGSGRLDYRWGSSVERIVLDVVEARARA
jgi:hypothetical protein